MKSLKTENNLLSEEINVNVNPNHLGIFNIQTMGIRNYSIAVFNLFGELIYSEREISGNHSINLTHENKGTYLLIIEYKREVTTKRLVVN